MSSGAGWVVSQSSGGGWARPRGYSCLTHPSSAPERHPDAALGTSGARLGGPLRSLGPLLLWALETPVLSHGPGVAEWKGPWQ